MTPDSAPRALLPLLLGAALLVPVPPPGTPGSTECPEAPAAVGHSAPEASDLPLPPPVEGGSFGL